VLDERELKDVEQPRQGIENENRSQPPKRV
jgi:hypothetical protein